MFKSQQFVVLTARFSNLTSGEISVRDIAINDLDPIDGGLEAQSRLDNEQIQQLASAYEGGTTIRQLSRQYGVDRTTVMRHLDNAGVKTRYRAEPLSKSEVRIAVERYEAGASMATIARELGVTSYVIGQELRRAGVQVRRRGFQASALDPYLRSS